MANRLLDEIGLTKRNDDGVRLLPDGRSMDLIIETAGESEEETDVLQLVQENWLELGIKAHVKPLQRQVLRNRIFAGETLMALWFGLENGIPSADMSPHEFAPTSQQQYQWPKWGQYFETGGQVGVAPDLPEAARLRELFEAWRRPPSTEARREIWHQMLEIWSEQVFSIGIIAGVPQPVVAHRTCATCRRRRSSTGSPAPSSASIGPTPSGSLTARTAGRGNERQSSSCGAPAKGQLPVRASPRAAWRTGTDAAEDWLNAGDCSTAA